MILLAGMSHWMVLSFLLFLNVTKVTADKTTCVAKTKSRRGKENRGGKDMRWGHREKPDTENHTKKLNKEECYAVKIFYLSETMSFAID